MEYNGQAPRWLHSSPIAGALLNWLVPSSWRATSRGKWRRGQRWPPATLIWSQLAEFTSRLAAMCPAANQWVARVCRPIPLHLAFHSHFFLSFPLPRPARSSRSFHCPQMRSPGWLSQPPVSRAKRPTFPCLLTHSERAQLFPSRLLRRAEGMIGHRPKK